MILNIFRKSRTPTSVIFTTSGVATSPFKLTHIHQQSSPSVPASHVFLRQIIHFREREYILSGHFNNKPVIGKLLCSQPGTSLKAEFDIYQKLRDLQGSAIPRCFGLFEVETLGLLLLLEDCGRSLHSFHELSTAQRCV